MEDSIRLTLVRSGSQLRRRCVVTCLAGFVLTGAPARELPALWCADNAVAISGDGMSWADAWKTFVDIDWTKIGPGDTLYLSGGVTSTTPTGSFVVRASGTTEALILIPRGVDAGHDGVPILDGGDTAAAARRSAPRGQRSSMKPSAGPTRSASA